MRWPTPTELTYATLVSLFVAILLLLALGIGLGDKTWFMSAVDFFIVARDSYRKTLAKAVADIKILEATVKARNKEIDDLIREQNRLKRMVSRLETDLEAAQRSLKEARTQIDRLEKAHGQGLAEYAIILAAVAAFVLLTLTPIGVWLLRWYGQVGMPFS